MSSQSANAVFTVSQLNQRAKQLLEISFASVRVEGEISNLSRPSSGHWYFTLKDQGAQVRCAMFRSRTAQLRFQPKEGDKVELRAKVSLYENRGDYQLIVDAMKPAGEGALLLAFEQLKNRLAHEGLFASEYKKPITTVKRIALITSPTGAAVQDMLTVLKRRNPAIEISIYPTQVQGRDATPQIVGAIERANRDNWAEAIIVGRGGGSLEDLWCFNEEVVARAIFASHIPVVSAVGHETDTTIADFVADARAPTPSAAAELLSSDQQVQQRMLTLLSHRLQQSWSNYLVQQRQRVTQVFSRLRTPQQQLNSAAQQLDNLEIRLTRAWQQQQQQRQQALQVKHQALVHQHPTRLLNDYQKQLEQLQKQLQYSVSQTLQQANQKLNQQAHLLNNLSPLQVLGRGYSISQKPDGEVLESVKQLEKGDSLHTRLHHGWIECSVTDIHTNSDIHSEHGDNADNQ